MQIVKSYPNPAPASQHSSAPQPRAAAHPEIGLVFSGARHGSGQHCFLFCAAKNSACSSANGVFVYRFEFYLFQFECAGVEAVVGAFLHDEVAVAATFDDVAVVEHHDDVGVLDRR